MLVFKVEISVELDGAPIPGFPFVRRLVTTEGLGFDYVKPSGAGFVTLPTGEIATLTALLVRSDKAVTLRLNGQSDSGIVLNPDGFFLLMDGTINAGSTVNATVQNTSGEDARVDGLAAGN